LAGDLVSAVKGGDEKAVISSIKGMFNALQSEEY
jgi:hypothetical protein